MPQVVQMLLGAVLASSCNMQQEDDETNEV